MIYLDSSAILKLVVAEKESAGLRSWLVDHEDEALVSSALSRVEVLRGARRLSAAALPAARAAIDALDLIPLSTPVLVHAAEVGGPLLRSLDAVHLASARSIAGDVTAFVAYDPRLAQAAAETGLPVAQPA